MLPKLGVLCTCYTRRQITSAARDAASAGVAACTLIGTAPLCPQRPNYALGVVLLVMTLGLDPTGETIR